jgi:hypothetical protein
MRLPASKRQAYIGGLRAMMREIDQVPKKLRVSNDGEPYSQIAALLSLFAGDEALAAAPGIPSASPQGLKCGAGYKTRMVIHEVPGTNVEPKAICVVGERQSSKCSASTIGVRAQGDGTWECATLSSFNLVPDNFKARLRTVPNQGSFLLKGFLFGNATEHFINGQPTAEVYAKRAAQAAPRRGLQIVLVDPSKMPPKPADPAAARAIAKRDAERARLEAARTRGTTATTAAAVAAPVSAQFRDRTNYQAVDNDGSAAIVVTPVETTVAAAVSTGPTESPDGSAGPSEELANSPEVSDDENGSSVQASALFQTCGPPAEKTCDADKVEKARQQYATDPNPDCIYAGSISNYQDGKKRAYKCVAPSQFCYGSMTCARANGERLKADYSCATNQVICNPLLFGVQADGKSPFCIEKGAQATSTCDETSKADKGAVSPLGQTHAGLKEAWNDFSDHLYKMCNENKIAAALHCAECDVITKRLFALNVAARSVASCGAAIKFEDSQCDADGKCRGLPGQPAATGGKAGARGVSDTGSKRFEIRGDREVSSVKPEPGSEPKSDSNTTIPVHSTSDVKPKAVDSVFEMPAPRTK